MGWLTPVSLVRDAPPHHPDPLHPPASSCLLPNISHASQLVPIVVPDSSSSILNMRMSEQKEKKIMLMIGKAKSIFHVTYSSPIRLTFSVLETRNFTVNVVVVSLLSFERVKNLNSENKTELRIKIKFIPKWNISDFWYFINILSYLHKRGWST